MNTPDDELVSRLRTTFERGVDSVGDVDIREAVTQRAGRIRRTRRLAAVAVAAVVIAAVPVSAATVRDVVDRDASNGPATQPTQPTQPTRPTSPPPTAGQNSGAVAIDLASLPAGDAPTVPYLVGTTWHDVDRTVDLAESYSPYLSLPFGDHVFTDYVAGEGVDTYAVDDRPRHELSDDTGYHHSPVAGPGDSVWWVEPRYLSGAVNPTWQLGRLTIGADGSEQRESFPIPGVWGGEGGSFGPPVLHGFVDNELIATVSYTGEEQSQLVGFPAADPSRSREIGDYQAARLVDASSGLVFGVTGWKHGRYCGDLFDLADLRPLWSSCDWSPVASSPDGSRLFAVPASQPVVNDTVAVLDATNGQPLLTLTMEARRSDGFAGGSFEDDDTIDVSAGQARREAIIRCSLADASCETAVAPSKQSTTLSLPAYE